MKNQNFSKKQLLVLSWWHPYSDFFERDAIICDGAVRSGKSFAMFISFVFWSFASFNNQVFGICGKTITSISRNLILPMTEYLTRIGFVCNYINSKNKLIIKYKNKTNIFYIFGGKDESSASLIQGITLAGVLFDEVVLMPQSFVEQALSRCSINGSKFWFNCNPDHPNHWFYKNWICKLKTKNALYINFKMTDNPSLTKKIIDRYKQIYSDSFYKRFVEGEWCAPDGLVYQMFDKKRHVVLDSSFDFKKYYVSCDYGTVNPTSMGLWGFYNNKWYRIKEFYYSSKKTGRLKTDEEYYQDLLDLTAGKNIEAVIIDPSAASFSQCIISHSKFKVIAAQNDVLTGISKVAKALNTDQICFDRSCVDTFREFSLYQWGKLSDAPKKENDHAMDDIRYFVSTIIYNNNYNNKNITWGFSSLARKNSF
ncbi:MAG: PBSX family phage terminase large subunit [Oscillospiraceae bacterium]|nr:PBSX family phage terminase large subunit [Oscillospiraceae bacterium]